MKIGARIIKTAAGSGLSIFIAQWLGLSFYASAGILTILCMETTKKKSLRAVFKRFKACLISLAFGGIFFETFGYHAVCFSVFILLLIPILIRLNIKEGFITSVVIALHVFSLKEISYDLLLNEFLLILIGTGVALLINSHMPKLEEELGKHQEAIEIRFKKILHAFADHMSKEDERWDEEEMLDMEHLFNEAKSVAIKNVENHLTRREDKHYRYFEMREKQFEILSRIAPVISKLDVGESKKYGLAEFLYDLSEKVREENTSELSLEKLHRIKQEIDRLPLPATRKELESRASVLYLIEEFDRYLCIKKQLKT